HSLPIHRRLAIGRLEPLINRLTAREGEQQASQSSESFHTSPSDAYHTVARMTPGRRRFHAPLQGRNHPRPLYARRHCILHTRNLCPVRNRPGGGTFRDAVRHPRDPVKSTSARGLSERI